MVVLRSDTMVGKQGVARSHKAESEACHMWLEALSLLFLEVAHTPDDKKKFEQFLQMLFLYMAKVCSK